MATGRDADRPRTFFLNETHELSVEEKGGGGRVPEYLGVSWAQKGRRISQSIGRVLHEVETSQDPLRDRSYFVVAHPVPELEKRSKSKTNPSGKTREETDFGGTHGKVFERL